MHKYVEVCIYVVGIDGLCLWVLIDLAILLLATFLVWASMFVVV